jgi:hypothetical protein
VLLCPKNYEERGNLFIFALKNINHVWPPYTKDYAIKESVKYIPTFLANFCL